MQRIVLDKWRLAACGLIAAGLFLRLYRLDLMEFKGDEQEALNLGIRLLADRPWASDKPWPRHGMPSSTHVMNAPLFNWIMAGFWALTNHPVRAVVLVALVNGVALYPLWRWAVRRMDQERALILLAVVAVSPFAVIFSRKLWAQDLLLPGLVGVLWAVERWREGRPWQAAILFGIATLTVGQLHQSGPIALAVLPVAIGIQYLLASRRQLAPPITRPSGREVAALALVVAMNAFFWIPYLQYLTSVPSAVFANRPTLAHYEPALLVSVFRQVVPLDVFYFFAPDRADFLAHPLRTFIYRLTIVFATPLAVYGAWRWMRAALQLPIAGVWWWLVVAAFTVARIPTYPFYVLILSPLPAALAAGAFDGRIRQPWLERTLLLWRWTYVAALAALTFALGLWLSDRGGSRGDYGVVYAVREAQARAVLGEPDGSGPARGEVTSANRLPLECHPVPVEVEWLVRWQRPEARLPDNLEICGGWRRETSSTVYQWTIRR